MGLYTLFVILILLAAVLMILVVLIQESKGGGLSSNFSSYNSLAGVRKTTDFIEKATWGLDIAMVFFSIVCAWVAPTAVTDSLRNQQPTPTHCQVSVPAKASLKLQYRMPKPLLLLHRLLHLPLLQNKPCRRSGIAQTLLFGRK